MADKKISQLTAASTPLAGTEVLPIVQSGATVKIAVSDVTAGRAVSGTQFTASTGNFIIGTAGKGIDFSANTAAPGATSELLNWYEEGAWTPVATSASGTITTYTSNGRYTRVGNIVYVVGVVGTSNIGTASGKLNVAGLPFTTGASYYSSGLGVEVINTGTSYFALAAASATSFSLQNFVNGGVAWQNNSQYHFSLTYRV
jgi:hypothetical protein